MAKDYNYHYLYLYHYHFCENFGLLYPAAMPWLAVTSLTRPISAHLVIYSSFHGAGRRQWRFLRWAHEFGCMEVSLDQTVHEPAGKPCLIRSLRKTWNVTRRNVGNDGRTVSVRLLPFDSVPVAVGAQTLAFTDRDGCDWFDIQ